MNIDNNLILVKGEHKTASVISWRFDPYKPVVFITHSNHREYPYRTDLVEFHKNPRIVFEEYIPPQGMNQSFELALWLATYADVNEGHL